MCNCGDIYCDLEGEARIWANKEHDRLLNTEYWQKRYPDFGEREAAIERSVRSQKPPKHEGPYR